MRMLVSVFGDTPNQQEELELDLPPHIQEAVLELQREYEEGDITKKGFEKKLNKLIENYLPNNRATTPLQKTVLGSLPNSGQPVTAEDSTQVANANEQFSPYQDILHPRTRSPLPMENEISELAKKFSNYSLHSEYIEPKFEQNIERQRPRSNTGSSGVGNNVGFQQVTSKLEVQTRGVYPKPPILANRQKQNHAHSQTYDPSLQRHTPPSKFRTMPSNSGFRAITQEQLSQSRPQSSVAYNNSLSPPNSHHLRNQSANLLGESRYSNFMQRPLTNFNPPTEPINRRQFSPPSSGKQVDEVPHYLRGGLGDVRSKGLFTAERMGNYTSPPRIGGDHYEAPKDHTLYSPGSHYGNELDNFDRSSLNSRHSLDRGILNRRPSVDSSHQSLASRDSPSFYTYTDLKPMPVYPNIIGVLNHRTIHTPKAPAYTVIDAKGKEAVRISWERFHRLVDKYHQLLMGKKTSHLPPGTRVSLFFRKVEITEFLAACFGCFVAGLVAVPIVATENLADFRFILENSQSWAVVTTETNYKSLAKGDDWINQYEWLRASDRLPQQFKRKRVVPFKDPADMTDLAVLEYSKDQHGELRGVGISHRTLIAQCQAFRELLEARDGTSPHSNPNLPVHAGTKMKGLVVGVEPRAHLGFLLGGFIAPFCGFQTILLSSAVFNLPEGFLSILSKFSVNYAVVDYPGLQATIQYHQGNPNRNADHHALINLELLMIDTLVPDPHLDQEIMTFFLSPFGCPAPLDALAPVCSLPHHGGMIVSIGEPALVGGEENERNIYLSRESLRRDLIQRVDSRSSDSLVVVSFGCLLPEVTVIIVNPQDNTVCSPEMVGEIWVDSPSLSGGYWNLPTKTELEFHARAFFPDTLQPLEGEFLRTGLAGSLVDQQLVVFGLLDQILRTTVTNNLVITNHSVDVVRTLQNATNRHQVEDLTLYPTQIHNQPAVVVVAETKLELESDHLALVGHLRTLCLEHHQFVPFAILLTPSNSLPRKLRNGAELISYSKSRAQVQNGCIPTLHVSIDTRGCELNSYLDLERDLQQLEAVPQHTGMEIMPPAVDERFGSDLEGFRSITQLLQWRATAGGDDPAFATVDARGRDVKVLTFMKTMNKTLNLAHHLTIGKRGLVKHSAVLIFMPPGLDYILAVHACLAADLIAIPYWDFDAARLHEEIPTLVRLVEDFKIQAILVNSQTEDRLKAKNVLALFKNYPHFQLPQLISVTKVPKPNRRLDGQFSGQGGILVLVHFSPDMKRQCISFSPSALLHQCKLHKYDLGLNPSRPLLACARVYNGIGFFHSTLLGIYVGCQTLLLSQADFAASPRTWFELLASKGCGGAYATLPMLRHAANSLPSATLQALALPRLKCLIVPMEGRLEGEALDTATSSLGLNSSSLVAPAYTTPFHTLVSHRAFLNQQDPLVLNLHFGSLRLGRVEVMDDNAPDGLRLRDSGRVARDTMVAIVNPVTGVVCQLHEVGEIWVASDSNADGLCFPETDFEAARFGAQIDGGDPSLYYVRTGDLGFLYPDTRHDPRPLHDIIATTPLLYVLGPMDMTFDANSASHYANDVEYSIESLALNINSIESPPIISCVTVALDETRVAAIVEVAPTILHPQRLTVPIITVVVEQHGFLLESVIYVKQGSIRRSRLGEKARFLTKADLLSGAIQAIATFQNLQ